MFSGTHVLITRTRMDYGFHCADRLPFFCVIDTEYLLCTEYGRTSSLPHIKRGSKIVSSFLIANKGAETCRRPQWFVADDLTAAGAPKGLRKEEPGRQAGTNRGYPRDRSSEHDGNAGLRDSEKRTCRIRKDLDLWSV